jgi:hypothetical protein
VSVWFSFLSFRIDTHANSTPNSPNMRLQGISSGLCTVISGSFTTVGGGLQAFDCVVPEGAGADLLGTVTIGSQDSQLDSA